MAALVYLAAPVSAVVVTVAFLAGWRLPRGEVCDVARRLAESYLDDRTWRADMLRAARHTNTLGASA